jgi:twitching motility protein PilJ
MPQQQREIQAREILMIKKLGRGASIHWMAAMIIGTMTCLIGAVYTIYKVQSEPDKDQAYHLMVDEMRLLSQQIASAADTTGNVGKLSFSELSAYAVQFESLLEELKADDLVDETSEIDSSWQPIREATKVLLQAESDAVLVHEVLSEFKQNLGPIQSELTAVVDTLARLPADVNSAIAVQKMLWLTERIVINMGEIAEGGRGSEASTEAFREDTTSVVQLIDALKQGNQSMAIQQVKDARAILSINTVSELFSGVSNTVDPIVAASTELRSAARVRMDIAKSIVPLADSLAAFALAIERHSESGSQKGISLMALFGAPGIVAIGFLIVLYRSQRRRVLYTEEGVSEIKGALGKIAEGDLTVLVSEENTVTKDIARGINASTERQRQLIRNIRAPFQVSVEEINKIGKTALEQVNKGEELTRSVIESTTAATEMVRTSEEIKSSTFEAARASARNSEQVARGYELTKDMSKASVHVRESVQETSKSAKRQGELIQSVTTAAEYIQALNTKISVVAINTRIEAEKAGEHGRPFLAIAEAIGELLREAEEEGRKIISEVRMLQNMSAENLESMENTVGTVVTILEYIERLDSSLEGINDGSTAITAIITSVDDAAGQSADNAQHMNNSMAAIRKRNIDISAYSKYTQGGVSSLRKSMRNVAENLSQFRIREGEVANTAAASAVDELGHIQEIAKIYREDEMTALESQARRRKSAFV